MEGGFGGGHRRVEHVTDHVDCGGQAGLADPGYVPLPKDFQEKVATAVDAIA